MTVHSSAPTAAPGGRGAARLCTGPTTTLFDTETGRPAQWARAAELCDRCPALQSCRADLARAYPRWGPGRSRGNPAGVVWAGAIFSPHRRLFTRAGLNRALTVGARRPPRVARPAPAPAPPVLAGAAP